MERAIVSAEALSFSYPTEEGKAPHVALREVDISVQKGEFVAVLGHNGSGKSTFAKHLNAILLPAVVTFNAQTISARYGELSRQLGFSSGSDAVALRALKNGLIRLRRELKLPDTLFAAGIEPNAVRERTESLTEAILEDPCCRTNPSPPTPEAVRRLLREVTGHG